MPLHPLAVVSVWFVASYVFPLSAVKPSRLNAGMAFAVNVEAIVVASVIVIVCGFSV